jgi:hypothetical protein
MGNLTIDATAVRLVRGSDEVLLTAPMGEAGTAGQYFRLNTTTGKLEKGNGTTTGEVGTVGGILLDTVATINLTGTIALRGSKAILDLGEAVAALAFDASVFLSDTDATLADTAGTVSTVLAKVVPGWNATTADKLVMLV